MQLGKVHLPCTRIHHAEIASVQISQGEYYFSGRYKDFFPEGERSFFVFARHGRALTGASPEHAQIVGSV